MKVILKVEVFSKSPSLKVCRQRLLCPWRNTCQETLPLEKSQLLMYQRCGFQPPSYRAQREAGLPWPLLQDQISPGRKMGRPSGRCQDYFWGCLHMQNHLVTLFGVENEPLLVHRAHLEVTWKMNSSDQGRPCRSSQTLAIFTFFFLYSEVLQSDLKYCFQSESEV